MTMDSAVAGAIAEGGIIGAVAMVGGSEGVRYGAAFGQSDAQCGAAMAVDSVFQLASMTKAITSVAVMQLVERGRLRLDEPVGALLPGLAAPQILTGFDAAGAPMLRPARKAITLRHLLTHTAGLGYDFVHADLGRSRPAAPAPGSLASICGPLLYEPGEDWEYSVATDWLGLAVEAASGLRLDAYIAAEITGPLGMTDTVFDLDSERKARLAMLYARTADGGMRPYPISIGGGTGGEFVSGGGGICGTAGDYMRFLRMLLCGGMLDGQRILAPETVAEMSRNQIGDLRAGAMASAVPAFSHVIDVFPAQHSKWGLGFLINPETGPNGRAPGSLAWAGIANTYYWIDPVNDIAGVLLMQFLPFGDPAALQVYAAFEREVYRGAQP